MVRKKQTENSKSNDFLKALRQETFEGILAIIFIIISIFLLLAAFNKAGPIGNYTFNGLTWLFGIGYYLLPILLVLLGISFIKSLSHNLAWPKVLGAFLILLSGLGVIELLVARGGVVGSIINKPVVGMFGEIMTGILHVGFFLIGLIIIFDLSIRESIIEKWIEKRKKAQEEKQRRKELGEEFNYTSDDEEDEYEEEYRNNKKEVLDHEEKSEETSDSEKIRKDDVDDSEKNNKKSNGDNKNAGGLIFFSKKSSHFKEYKAPPLSLLEKDSGKPGVGDIKANSNIIKRTLANFGIQVEMDEISIGPSVTRYSLKPAQGVKLSRIVALQNDLSLALAAKSIRIEAPIPGKSLVGIEIPNNSKTTVGLGSTLREKEYQDSNKPLTISIGKGITGDAYFANLAKMPHLLVAGATGAGKSVTIHAIIASLLYRNSPEILKFIMIDPKRVELTMYNKIPHLLTPVITDAKKTILALKWAGKEMNRRYDILESHGVRDISSYHKNILEPALKNKSVDDENLPEKMPYICIFIDELADIMQTYPRELEAGIVRLAQMSRAVGIHLIISTQRPSVNVITGLIKANVPARIALQVSSQIDSRTILDTHGAEKLLGAGDMLYVGEGVSQPVRLQSPFISEEEVKNIVNYLATNYEQDDISDNEINLEKDDSKNSIFDSLGADGISNDDELDDEDDLYEEAKEIVLHAGKASTSYLQRKLRIGYSRAARIMDILENKGVIGPADGSKPREVLLRENDSENDELEDDDRQENSDSEDYFGDENDKNS